MFPYTVALYLHTNKLNVHTQTYLSECHSDLIFGDIKFYINLKKVDSRSPYGVVGANQSTRR